MGQRCPTCGQATAVAERPAGRLTMPAGPDYPAERIETLLADLIADRISPDAYRPEPDPDLC